MTWQAKSGCAEHHRAAVERIANSFPMPGFLHLAQARFLIILSTAIAACAPGPSSTALILSAMEEAPRPILAIDLGVYFMV